MGNSMRLFMCPASSHHIVLSCPWCCHHLNNESEAVVIFSFQPMEREKEHGGVMLGMLRPRTKSVTHHFLSYFTDEVMVTWPCLLQGRLGNKVSYLDLTIVNILLYFVYLCTCLYPVPTSMFISMSIYIYLCK